MSLHTSIRYAEVDNMRAMKIAAFAVALLFILVVFQNSYSIAVAQANDEENETESALPEVKNREQSSISEPISSVPGPPTSTSALEALEEGSITRPREQYAISESLLLVIAFFVFLFFFILMIPLFVVIAPVVLVLLPLLIPLDILFILLVMFLPVLLASFAGVSSYEIPTSIQRILNEIGSKGTPTEILFAYFKNLWPIVLNLPEIVRLTSNLNTEDYADIIKRFGSFVLDYPANLRALPNKILTNLFPTVNALPGWLRQSPVLLQVFPLLMYALVVLPLIAILVFAIFVVFGLTLTPILFLVLLILASPLIIAIGAIAAGGGLAALGFFLGAAVGVILGIGTFIGAIIVLAAIGAFIGFLIGLAIVAFVVGVLWVLGFVLTPLGWLLLVFVAVVMAVIITILCGIIGFLIGAIGGIIAFAVIIPLLTVIGLIGGVIIGSIAMIVALLVIIGAIIILSIGALFLLPLALVFGAPITLILVGLIAMFILPLTLPIGPQAVKSYPAIFRLFLSLAENSIAIPLGLMALPVSALISVFRGLPGSLRAVIYHTIDFISMLFIVPMRALPLSGTFVVLIVLWLVGMVLALIFSPLLLIAPVFIVLAIFVEGLKDDDIDAISDDGIKASIDNLPESVGEIDIVIERLAEMLGKAATTDISGLLDSLLDVNWLIVTQNLPYALPEAMQSIGSAIPAIVNSCPSIIKTLIDSGLTLTIEFVEMLSDTIIAQIRNIFALIWVMPEFAVLIPQLLEILSVLTINLPALIKGFIPAAIDAVEQTTVSLPELFPSIVLSTMGLNSIVLQFARGVWRISMRVSDIIIQTLWYLILLLPSTIFDFDEFVTPWFGPRLLSVVGACIGALPAGCIGVLSGFCSMIISGFLSLGMCCYLPGMILMQLISFSTSIIQFCCVTPFTTFSSCLSLSDFFISLFAGTIDALCQYPVSDILIGAIAFIQGAIDTILEPINNFLSLCGDFSSALSFLTDWLLPVFFMILVVMAIFPLIGIVAGFLTLAFFYFGFYIMQIFAGTLLMACSGVFQSVVFVPLMSLCEDVPVASTILGYLMTLTGFYAFCIPPNFIEIITQLIPLGVNLLASIPSLIFMPISLIQTFISASSTAVEALPSVPAYLGRLTDRIIFSSVAEILALFSFAIDALVASILSCFAVATGIIGEMLSLDILTNAPKIAVLVLALIFVMFAWIVDLVGVLCLRTPDMINEYTNSILKSMAMMPVLSAIIPDMAAAPAAMQPEVVSEGLSKILIIGILFIPAALGAFVALVYNLLKDVVLWCYNTFPALVTLPFRLPTIVLNRLNEIFSQVSSIIGGAAGSLESQLVPY